MSRRHTTLHHSHFPVLRRAEALAKGEGHPETEAAAILELIAEARADYREPLLRAAIIRWLQGAGRQFFYSTTLDFMERGWNVLTDGGKLPACRAPGTGCTGWTHLWAGVNHCENFPAGVVRDLLRDDLARGEMLSDRGQTVHAMLLEKIQTHSASEERVARLTMLRGVIDAVALETQIAQAPERDGPRLRI